MRRECRAELKSEEGLYQTWLQQLSLKENENIEEGQVRDCIRIMNSILKK